MTARGDRTGPDPHRSGRLLIVLAFVSLAFNLRQGAVSIGPLLAEITDALGMTPTIAGVLTALPLLAFATFGAAAPWVSRFLGLHRTLLASVLLIVVGLLARSLVGNQWAFLGLSLVALVGMAMANVLLPSLVRLHFPDRIGFATALYTTALALGATGAFLLTVPIAQAMGDWRAGLGAWGVIALLAALPWLGLLRRDTGTGGARTGVSLHRVARTRLGVAMALFFGLQSMQAYTVFGWFAQMWRDSGYSATQAGALVAVLSGVSVPVSLLMPTIAARSRDQRVLMVAVMLCYPVGYLGLIFAPHALGLLWALVIGLASSAFPLVLVLITLRSRTPEGTAALSALTQSGGYLLAVVGPIVIGALYGATGGWTWPLSFLLVLGVPQLVLGLYIARPLVVEDQLAALDGRAGTAG